MMKNIGVGIYVRTYVLPLILTFFRLTDLGSITPSVDTSTLRKKTSSVPGGETIYPIPVPYYKQTPLPPINEPEKTPEEACSNPDPLPQLEPGDHLLMPTCPNIHKPNTPDLERKTILLDKIKSKGKELINMMYSPHEDEIEQVEPESPNDKLDEPDSKTPEDLIETLGGSAKYWVGKDYVNFIVQDFNNLDSPFDDFIDRCTTPRMPWHDIGMCVQGAAARDVARHFIQRWNATKIEKANKNISVPFLMPKTYSTYTTLPINLPNMTHKVTCQVNHFTYLSISN